MKEERLQHIKDVLYSREISGISKGIITIGHKEAQDIIQLQSDYDKLKALSILQDEYIALLGKEIGDMAGVCTAHGWMSRNFHEGKEIRAKMSQLRAGLTINEKG